MLTLEKKKEKVALAKAHVEAERLIAGFYTESKSDKGCSVGCDAYDIRNIKGDDWGLDDGPEVGNHAYVADYFGTPEWLEHLRDIIFESLPREDRAEWHIDLAEALPVGIGLESVRHQIQRDILLEVAAKSIGEGKEDWREKCRASVHAVAALHGRAITEKVSEGDWSAAYSAARSAARSAAYSLMAKIILKHLREATDV